MRSQKYFAGDRPPWGYRRAHHELCLEGWEINRKRVQRVWREEGLRVAAKTRKRRRVGDGAGQQALEQLVARRGRAPACLRCDNGPELTSHALRDWWT